MSRFGLWTIPAALLVALVAAGPATAGGGGGGECFQDPPPMPEGWVAVLDSCFAPQTISASSGTGVRWNMNGEVPHTVTFYGGPDSGPLEGSGFAIRFNRPGTYEYFCNFHPGMTGSVEVSGSALPGVPAMQLLGEDGEVIAGSTGFGGDASASSEESSSAVPEPSGTIALAPARQSHRIELHPLTAMVVLIVLFPLSMSAAMRLLGPARRLAPVPRGRVRVRLPFYVDEPQASTGPAKPSARR